MLNRLRLALPLRCPPWVAAALALAAGAAALGLAAQHPLSAALALAATWAVLALVWWRPQAWPVVLPALLPVLSLSPWTGWWLFDESDLLVLAVLAGGYARMAVDAAGGVPQPGHATARLAGPARDAPAVRLLATALMGTLLIGLLRGWSDAGAAVVPPGALNTALNDTLATALYAGHDSAWNTLRVAKSLLWALLLLPLLRATVQAGQGARWALGMVCGLVLVAAVVLWERHTYAALFDFSGDYRTSAAVWDMQVGGGAIDAYLALAVPFACWAVWSAPTRVTALVALGVLGLGVYAVLTTYSRGVLLALLASLLGMVALALRARLPLVAPGLRPPALALAVLLLGLETAVVLGAGSMLPGRLEQTGDDLEQRLAHWRAGLSLLDGAGDWLLGLGLGRLPAHHSRRVPGAGYPGRLDWDTDAQGRARLWLSGPSSGAERAPDFALTQRVRLAPLAATGPGTAGLAGASSGAGYSVRWRASPESGAATRLRFSLCERHLLYSARCQTATARAAAGVRTLRLQGPAFERSGGVLAISVLEAGQRVRLQSLELLDPHGRQRLRNTGFEARLQHWWPIAQGQFQPWHIDSLYLELLIERGLLGLAVFGAWVAWAVHGMARALHGVAEPTRQAGQRLAWVLSGAVLGLLVLGAVVGLMDSPRVALLAMLCLWFSEHKGSP